MALIIFCLDNRMRGLAITVILALASSLSLRAADVPVTITIDAARPQPAIASGFAGLSYELALVSAAANGRHYFRPDNAPLIAMFRTLGLGNLRVGGNTSDRNARDLPTEADVDLLFAFARAANVKVIYCLRLHDGTVADATQRVRYILSHYAALMDSFSIGQEPSAYPTEAVDRRPPAERMGGAAENYPYPTYHDEWKAFADAIAAAVPNVTFCGPSVHNNPEWTRRFIADFGHANHVGLITAHLYPGGAAGKLPSPEIGRDRMLSDNFTQVYETLYAGFAADAKAAGLPYRLEEANSYFNGGAQGASNTFSAALWGLDFLYWWAAHDAAGINFHTGDRVAAGPNVLGSRYAVFVSNANGYTALPLAYGIKAFDVGAHGRLISTTIANAAGLNLTAYAVRAEDGAMYVTIINKEHTTEARVATVSLPIDRKPAHAEAMWLKTASGDVASTNDITLGGAVIESDGSWSGTWTHLPLSSQNEGQLTITVPAASAAIVRVSDTP
jgi:hypothetical protein